MLSVLLLRGWRATLVHNHAWSWRVAFLAWLGTVFVAAMDEWHQSFISSRTGTWRDAVLDSVAGFLFFLGGDFFGRPAFEVWPPPPERHGPESSPFCGTWGGRGDARTPPHPPRKKK